MSSIMTNRRMMIIIKTRVRIYINELGSVFES
jgi:hypothetical protein